MMNTKEIIKKTILKGSAVEQFGIAALNSMGVFFNYLNAMNATTPIASNVWFVLSGLCGVVALGSIGIGVHKLINKVKPPVI